jgi:hypothetical protein
VSAIAGLLVSAIDATVAYTSNITVKHLIKLSIDSSFGVVIRQSQLITSLWHAGPMET